MKKIVFISFFILYSFNSRSQTFSNNSVNPIPDNNTLVCFPVTVSGLQNHIDTAFGLVSCCIDITHTYDSDLRIYLKGPNNLQVDLSSTNGGGNDNYSGTCFKMDGLQGSIVNGTAPFLGTFVPEQSINLFNNGIDPNGDWYLCVKDEVPNDSGTVNSFSITFGNNPPPDPVIPIGICSTTDASGCACPVPGQLDCDLLPDMTASALEIQNGYYEYPGHIDLSNATPNIGYGPLEIRGNGQCFCDTISVPCTVTMCPDSSLPKELVTQRIYHKNANGAMTTYDVQSGTMTYHPSHGHIHVDDWASYTLRVSTTDPDPRNWPIIGVGTKTSYCLVNLGNCNSGVGICVDTGGTVYTQANLPNYGLGAISGCGTEQGIFVGSYDVYSAGLDGQRIDISNVCNDNYYIVSITDPDNHFIEINEQNNWVSVPVTLNQQPGTTPVSSFTYSSSGMSFGFFNYATGSNTYHWNFGDGTVDSTGQVVQHNYLAPGNYVVVLTIDNGTCQATSAQIVTVQSSVQVQEIRPVFSSIKVSPNPSNAEVHLIYQLNNRLPVSIELFDTYGKKIKILQKGAMDAGSHDLWINKGELAPGSYLIKWTSPGENRWSKFVILN